MFGLGPYGSYAFAAETLTPTWPTAGAAEKVLLLTPTDSDAATLASGSTPQLALANLQDMHPAKKWRSAAATTSDYITLALAKPVAANALALVAHNLTSSGWLRARGANTAAEVTTSPVVDTKLAQAWPLGVKPNAASWNNYTALLRWTNDTPLQYWRVDICDGGLVTYLEAGRLVLGRYFQPSLLNLDFNSPLGFSPADVQANTDFGGTQTDARYRPRTRTLTFAAMKQSDLFAGIHEIQRLAGMARDVIVCVDPAATDTFHIQTLQGVMTSGGNYVPQVAWTDDGQMVWSLNIPFREILF